MESSWVQMSDKRKFQQEKKKSRSEMQRDSKMVRCTTEKTMRRYKGTFDIFFGVEPRMRKKEMEEQFNQEAKQDWRFAADAAGGTRTHSTSSLESGTGLERRRRGSSSTKR